MIKTWRNSVSRRIFEEGRAPKRFGSLDLTKAQRRLQAVSDAKALIELRVIRSFRLHKLRGNRKGQWSISLNGPCRICFSFDEDAGDAHDVEVTDYH